MSNAYDRIHHLITPSHDNPLASPHTVDLSELSGEELYVLCEKLRGLAAWRDGMSRYGDLHVSEAGPKLRDLVANEEKHERYLHSWGQAPDRQVLLARAEYLRTLV